MHDLDNMGVADFWANAGETLRRGTGDSEDIAIAKMQVLKAAGFSPKDLYISIGRHNVRGAHVVLLARAAGSFYVLDDTLQNIATPAQHARFTPIMTLGQGMSWIHETDLNRLFERALFDATMHGVYIASSPNPVSQKEFMRELRRAVRMPIGIPANSWMVRFGARWLLRTDPELALYGRYVISKRLAEQKFAFQFAELREAFTDLFNRARSDC